MSYKYDADKYRALGVGETVKIDHLEWDGEFGKARPINVHFVGHVLDGTEFGEYLEALPAKSKLEHATGARSNGVKGKGRFDLVPYEGMLSAAMRFEVGADDHGPRNWELGIPLSVLLSKMRRHAHKIGYAYDEDHNGAVLANAMMFAAMVSRMRAGILPKELDDIGYFINEEATKR